MKHIIFSALFLSFALFPIQDVKIKGKYKIEYDYSYGSPLSEVYHKNKTLSKLGACCANVS